MQICELWKEYKLWALAKVDHDGKRGASWRMSHFGTTVHITDLDKLNLVKLGYGGLVLSLRQLLLMLQVP